MTSLADHAANRAALMREREARQAAYLIALEEQEAFAAIASAAEATLYDQTALRRANSRVELRLKAMHDWNDPSPVAKAAPTMAVPEPLSEPPLERSGAVSPMSEADALVAQIIAAAKRATLEAKTNADRLANEIVASAELASVDEVDALAEQIIAAADAASGQI